MSYSIHTCTLWRKYRCRPAYNDICNFKRVFFLYSIILPVVLYGCESWSLTLRERNVAWGFLRIGCRGGYLGLWGTRWQEEWRKLHIEELNDLYCSPNIVRVIKSRRKRWAGHVARMGVEERCVYRTLWHNYATQTNKMRFYLINSLFLIFRGLLHVSNRRVHLQEDSCSIEHILLPTGLLIMMHIKHTLPCYNCIYNHLPENELSSSKHVDDIKRLKY